MPTDEYNKEYMNRRIKEAYGKFRSYQPHFTEQRAFDKALRPLVLDIEVGEQVFVESMVSAANNEPMVRLAVNDTITMLTIPKAREIAYWILRASSTATAEAFLTGYLGQEMGLTDDQKMTLFGMFRQYHEDLIERQAKED